jgi:hypothetical protein
MYINMYIHMYAHIHTFLERQSDREVDSARVRIEKVGREGEGETDRQDIDSE